MKLVKNSLNFVIKNFVIFLLAIAWTNFYIKPFYLSVIVACLITFMFSWLFRKLALKKEEKSLVKSAEKEAFNTFTLNLLTMPTAKQNELIANILKDKKLENKDGVIFAEGHAVINKISMHRLSVEDIYDIIKSLNTINHNKAIVFYHEIEASALNFIKSLNSPNIELYDLAYLFSETKKKNISIKSTITFNKKNKLKFKEFLGIIFARKNAKNYILLGIIMLLSSFIVFNPLFYVIYASIMFIFALICLFLKPEAPKSNILNS